MLQAGLGSNSHCWPSLAVTGIQDKHQNPPRPCHSLSRTLGHRPPVSGVRRTQSSRLTPGVCRAAGGPMPGPRGWEPSGAGRAASAGAPGLRALCCWDSDRPAGAAALGSAPGLGVGGALGGLSRVSPLLGHPAMLCVQVPWGYAHVEGLHSMWFSAQAPLWGGSVIVVIILPGKDVGIRAW